MIHECLFFGVLLLGSARPFMGKLTKMLAADDFRIRDTGDRADAVVLDEADAVANWGGRGASVVGLVPLDDGYSELRSRCHVVLRQPVSPVSLADVLRGFLM